MSVLLGFLLWYGMGLIGSALACEFFFRRGSEPIDIDVGTLVLSAFLALLGVLNLIAGLVFFAWWLFRTLFPIDFDRVIFKKYDKDD